LYAPYYLWRYHYYGWPFPNTFYVKSSGGAGTARRGLFYLWQFLRDYGFWFVLPLAVPPKKAVRPLFSLTLLSAAGFSLYVVSVGGDFMGLYRFLVPMLPLLALTAQEALRRLPGTAAPWGAAAFLFSFGLFSAQVSRRAILL